MMSRRRGTAVIEIASRLVQRRLARFTATDLQRIAASLNARPRHTLNMRTPAQALDALLTKPTAA
jgi:IS30 family transposase